MTSSSCCRPSRLQTSNFRFQPTRCSLRSLPPLNRAFAALALAAAGVEGLKAVINRRRARGSPQAGKNCSPENAGNDGHLLFSRGVVLWSPPVDEFLGGGLGLPPSRQHREPRSSGTGAAGQ